MGRDFQLSVGHYDEQETCYFLEGSVVVTPANGEPVQIGKGDLVAFPEGIDCVWEIKEPVRNIIFSDSIQIALERGCKKKSARNVLQDL